MSAAIVLAAGASSRLGRPKALVQIGARSAVAHLCETLLASGCAPVLVVLGAEGDQIAKSLSPAATAVRHEAWSTGRTGSLKAGLRALGTKDFVFAPVDHPAADAWTIARLRDARGAIRVPTRGGRRGHPVFFTAALAREILDLGDDQPLHDVVHRDPGRVTEVPVDDAGVLLNLDTPDDLKKLQTLLADRRHARDPA